MVEHLEFLKCAFRMVSSGAVRLGSVAAMVCVAGVCATCCADPGENSGETLAEAAPTFGNLHESLSLNSSAVSFEAYEEDDEPRQPAADPSDYPSTKPTEPDSFLRGWKGTVEGGLNGSDGNSQNLSFRFGLGATRETFKLKSIVGISYTYATSEGEKTKSRGVFDIRNDWRTGERWVVFTTGKVEYDEFQDWDWRISAFAGPGYYFIKSERTKLLGRVGAGLTKELGGSREGWYPEGLLGVDFEHKLTERQKLYASVEYLPDLSDLAEYRYNAKAGWEVLVDPEVHMTLKIGIEDRYDHNPGPDRKKNDVEYFALIAWSF